MPQAPPIATLSSSHKPWIEAFPLFHAMGDIEYLFGPAAQPHDIAVGIYTYHHGGPVITGCNAGGCPFDGSTFHAVASMEPLLVAEHVGGLAHLGREQTDGFAPVELRHVKAHMAARTGEDNNETWASGRARPGDVRSIGGIVFRRTTLSGILSFIVAVDGFCDPDGDPMPLWDDQFARHIADTIFTHAARGNALIRAAIPSGLSYMVGT